MSASVLPSLEPSSKHAQLLLENTIALIHQTALDKLRLVDYAKVSLLEWAKEYAACRFRYKEVLRLLQSGGRLNEADYVEEISIAQDAIKAGDSFILARAQADWEGDWVHPRWKKAALKRAEVQKEKELEKELEEQQKVENLLSRAADISQTGANELQFSYESEDEDFEDQLESSSQSSLPKNESTRPTISPDWITPGTVDKVSDDLPQSSSKADLQSKESPVACHSQSPSTSALFDSVVTPGPSLSLSQAILSSLGRPVELKRQPESPLQSEQFKRARIDDGAGEPTTSNQISTLSSPIQHKLPFDYRGLSKDAQRCLSKAKQIQQRTVDEVLLDLYRPNGSTTVNEAYVQEVSQTLGTGTNYYHQYKICTRSTSEKNIVTYYNLL
ncbi:hypothetical protein FB446DRAFT_814066 [Lentinula raphanica]|nr:hypothetical protein FB446DRAFT_814066 [Lentinula raphanica]KAJ3819228.1 hypothetical protein F5880DRAFT_1510327 [Lentinula raphanica]